MAGDNTERVGVNAVEAIFLNEFKWIFREQLISDFGIDAIVESFDDDKPSGRLAALQIKSGSSYFRKKGADFIFNGELRHLEYWTNHALPVFIILHNPKTGLTLWQKIETRLVTKTENGWSIIIPSENLLDIKAKEFFEAGIARDDEGKRRFKFAVDFDLMKEFQKHDEIYLRIDRWVNKTLSVRGVRIYYGEKDKSEADVQLGYWAAGYDNDYLMRSWFPWLDYE